MKKVVYIFFQFLIAFNIEAQDIHFSQFSETPLLRNPALAGIFTGDLRLQGIVRSQWGSVTVPFQTISFNGEYKFPVGKGDDFMTVGLEALYDKAGTVALTTTDILPALNYHKSLSAYQNMYLSLGVMGGFVQRKLDRSKITTDDQYDPGTGSTTTGNDGEAFSGNGYHYWDGSVGMSFNAGIGDNPDNNFYLALAYHHFNKATNISFYGNESVAMIPKWIASAGYRTAVNDYTYVTFYADYARQGASSEVLGGALYSYKLDDDVDNPKYTISGGLYYRLKDAVIPVAKLEYRPFAVALSYDINLSKLTSASRIRGGFEISLVYQRFNKDPSARSYSMKCPRF